MSFISKSIADRQFLLNKSFTYFYLIYHIVKLQFYCATIAYHVGLNALLVAARKYDQRLKKKDIYFLAVASGCRHVICPFVSTFLVGRRHFTVLGKYLLPFSIYISVQFYCYTSLFMYFIYYCIKHILANFQHSAFVICP